MTEEELLKIQFRPHDTSEEAWRVQTEALRRLGPEGRLRLCFEASANLRELVKAGVRMRHPDYTEEEVRLAVTRIMVGEEVMQKVMPWVTVQP
ncbi:MAG: hypothetical protein C4524_14615 [Candidatus Zixiibacteriota bacterium]|nr:MAG: hypothetical protein C4524_14615 [candidate division Zixibacteria bacterium]